MVTNSFDIFQVSASQTANLGCAHIFQKRTWGALIGVGVLNRANMVHAVALFYKILKNLLLTMWL